MADQNENQQALASGAQQGGDAGARLEGPVQPMSRRAFLIRAGVAGAAAMVLPAILEGCEVTQPLPRPTPPPHPDLALQWRIAVDTGIYLGGASSPGVWNSGHVNDIIELAHTGVDGAPLIAVGSDSGGVWIVDHAGESGIPMSDSWENPDVRCMAAGPDGPTHMFAACSRSTPDAKNTLYVSDPNSLTVAWREIVLPNPIGFINNMLYVPGNRRLVLATETGVFWAGVPTSTQGDYAFTQATDVAYEAATDGPFYGLALGPDNSIIVTSRTTSQQAGDFLYGTWGGSTLSLQAANLGIDGLDRLNITTTSVTSSPLHPTVAYAVSAGFDGTIHSFWTSTDGGRSWSGSVPKLAPPKNTPLGALSGDQGDTGWNNCIAVARDNPQYVVIGWVHLFVSTDGGQTWFFFDTSVDNHDDHHRIVFSETGRIYVASDGGACSTADFKSFDTAYNRKLATLQYYSPSAFRQEWGQLSASLLVPGLVVGGTQDNDNIFFTPSVTAQPIHVPLNDGGVTQLVGNFGLLAASTSGPVNYLQWDAAHGRFDLDSASYQNGAIPIVANGQYDDNGLIQARTVALNVTQVTPDGTLYALGAHDDLLYGLYGDAQGNGLHWRLLKQVPIASGAYISSLASYSGGTILVGATANQIFVLDTTKQTVQLATGLPEPASYPPDGAIIRIVCTSETDVFAAYFAVGNHGAVYHSGDGGYTWTSLSGLPSELIYTLEVYPKPNPPWIFTATDDRVFCSVDKGVSWQVVKQGLPRRCHCADLCWGPGADGADYLYLSTYGRSVFQARLS